MEYVVRFFSFLAALPMILAVILIRCLRFFGRLIILPIPMLLGLVVLKFIVLFPLVAYSAAFNSEAVHEATMRWIMSVVFPGGDPIKYWWEFAIVGITTFVGALGAFWD